MTDTDMPTFRAVEPLRRRAKVQGTVRSSIGAPAQSGPGMT